LRRLVLQQRPDKHKVCVTSGCTRPKLGPSKHLPVDKAGIFGQLKVFRGWHAPRNSVRPCLPARRASSIFRVTFLWPRNFIFFPGLWSSACSIRIDARCRLYAAVVEQKRSARFQRGVRRFEGSTFIYSQVENSVRNHNVSNADR